ncbi:MAG TPA: adenine phosphoribosyltransferase [Jatrophihabitantaceae bacterium]|jgi:adenine phosphoribosyltransferase|nr:adenine phosphoribosyltransferase [Jatrophihabitantaceae bacterium]
MSASASAVPVAGSGHAGTAIAELISSRLRDVPDFPQAGVLFKDIVPLLADGKAFGTVIDALADSAAALGPVELVAGIEARGFIIAAAIAQRLGCGLVPIRKAGKLPPPTLRRGYTLEYGTAEIEVPQDVLTDKRVYLVDDVLATGGTVRAALDLLAEANAQVIGVGVLLEIAFLAGRARLGGVDVQALLVV